MVTEMIAINEKRKLKNSEKVSKKLKVEDETASPPKCNLKLKKKKVLGAVDVLRQLGGGGKPLLLQEHLESTVMLQITMKKIPPKVSQQMIKVNLPHTLMQDTTDVCLITGDLDKANRKAESEPVVLHYKEFLKTHDISQITEVIPLRQLRTEYKTFESKRQLVAAYDIFLCDSKIAGVLPRLLGKFFFQKRKFPIQIRMNEIPSVKAQVDRALSQTTFFLSCRGNSCTSEIARLCMADKEIVENVFASVKTLAEKLPGSSANILGIYLKTAKSQSIPIYMSFDDGVKLTRRARKAETTEGDLSTRPNTRVRVLKDGRVILKKEEDIE